MTEVMWEAEADLGGPEEQGLVRGSGLALTSIVTAVPYRSRRKTGRKPMKSSQADLFKRHT